MTRGGKTAASAREMLEILRAQGKVRRVWLKHTDGSVGIYWTFEMEPKEVASIKG